MNILFTTKKIPHTIFKQLVSTNMYRVSHTAFERQFICMTVMVLFISLFSSCSKNDVECNLSPPVITVATSVDAGRIIYKQLTPFLWSELKNKDVEKYFERGGFPRSVLAADNKTSYDWRTSFISTFLERDLLQWLNFTPATMRRLWQMLAHVNGQTVNYSNLGNSLGVSNQTVKNYIDLLKSTYMVDVVEPYISNLGKRLVKAPKVYISDSGIVAALLGIRSFEEMSGHPAFGAVWETIVLANLRGTFPDAEIFYYRTAGGAEIDFVLQLNHQVIAIECKASYSPTLSKGNHIAITDIAPKHSFVVTPSPDDWAMSKGIDVVSLAGLMKGMKDII